MTMTAWRWPSLSFLAELMGGVPHPALGSVSLTQSWGCTGARRATTAQLWAELGVKSVHLIWRDSLTPPGSVPLETMSKPLHRVRQSLSRH